MCFSSLFYKEPEPLENYMITLIHSRPDWLATYSLFYTKELFRTERSEKTGPRNGGK